MIFVEKEFEINKKWFVVNLIMLKIVIKISFLKMF